jgi:hypothetical protein
MNAKPNRIAFTYDTTQRFDPLVTSLDRHRDKNLKFNVIFNCLYLNASAYRFTRNLQKEFWKQEVSFCLNSCKLSSVLLSERTVFF